MFDVRESTAAPFRTTRRMRPRSSEKINRGAAMIRGSALLLLAAAAWAQNPPLGPAVAGRTIVLVVDDLRLPAPTLLRVRQSLNEFVAQHLRPDDTVAELRTGADGALQFRQAPDRGCPRRGEVQRR